MILNKAKSLVIENGIIYIMGFIIIFGLKLYYSNANGDTLQWILAPTACWVEILSGIPFDKVLHEGFINHAHRIIIAPSCSGINFMIISFSTILFSFIHHLKTQRSKILWLSLSLILSYLFTIGVNGLRISLSLILFKADFYGDWITPERIHRIEGTVVYFFSLFIIYKAVEKLISYITQKSMKNCNTKQSEKKFIQMVYIWIPPLFWYFLFTLGIPLLNRSYKNDMIKFSEHSILIISVCLVITIVFSLFQKLTKYKL